MQGGRVPQTPCAKPLPRVPVTPAPAPCPVAPVEAPHLHQVLRSPSPEDEYRAKRGKWWYGLCEAQFETKTAKLEKREVEMSVNQLNHELCMAKINMDRVQTENATLKETIEKKDTKISKLEAQNSSLQRQVHSMEKQLIEWKVWWDTEKRHMNSGSSSSAATEPAKAAKK